MTYPSVGQTPFGLIFYYTIADSTTSGDGYRFWTNGGILGDVACTNCRAGYTNGTGISIVGSGYSGNYYAKTGSGGAVTATYSGGTVTGLSYTAGSGYANGTYPISFLGGGCTTQPAGTFTVNGGAIISAVLSSVAPGATCTSAPTMTLAPTITASQAGGSVYALTITQPGAAIGSGTFNLVFSGGGCTTQPTGLVGVDNGSVTSVYLQTQGSGCTSAPSVALNGGAAAAPAFVATMSGASPNETLASLSFSGTAGAGLTAGTFPLQFSVSCTQPPVATFTVASGAVTSTAILSNGSGCWTTPVVTPLLAAQAVQGVTLVGSAIENNKYAGINIGPSTDTLISGSIICNNGNGALNGYDGIYVGGAARWSVTGSLLGDCGVAKQTGIPMVQRYGIFAQGGISSAVTVEANTYTANLEGPALVMSVGSNQSIEFPPVPFSKLPACGQQTNNGARTVVTDASAAPSYLGAVTAGGGSNRVPVSCQGVSGWLAH